MRPTAARPTHRPHGRSVAHGIPTAERIEIRGPEIARRNRASNGGRQDKSANRATPRPLDATVGNEPLGIDSSGQTAFVAMPTSADPPGMRQLRWTPPTRYALMAHFGLGEDAQVTREVVEAAPRGARHQPRLRPGTRVRILDAQPDEGGMGLLYRVEVCDARGRPSGYWALVPEGDLAEASPLGLIDWLKSRRTG